MSMDRENQDRVRTFYDRQVSEHPESPAILGSSTRLHADYRNLGEWRAFSALVPVRRNSRILELGCGGGRWVERLAPGAREVIGVDISENAIALARGRAASLGLANARYEVSSIVDFRPQGMFDLVYFSGILLYLNDEEAAQAMDGIRDHLAADAAIVVRDSLTERPYERSTPDYEAHYRDEASISRLLGRIGYRLQARRRATPQALSPRLINSRHADRLYKLAGPVGLGGLLLHGLHWAGALSGRNLFPDTLDGIRYSHDFLVYAGGGKGAA
jgi:SAM-dependent methyltransferase